MHGHLLAQLQLLDVCCLAIGHQAKEPAELISRCLEHLHGAVHVHRVAGHLVVVVQQPGQEPLIHAQASGLFFNLVEGHLLGLDAERITHATDDRADVVGLHIRQVERFLRRLAVDVHIGSPLLDSSLDVVHSLLWRLGHDQALACRFLPRLCGRSPRYLCRLGQLPWRRARPRHDGALRGLRVFL